MFPKKSEKDVIKYLPWRLTPSSPLTVSMIFIIMTTMYAMVVHYSQSMRYDFSAMAGQILYYKEDLLLLSAIGIFTAFFPLISKIKHAAMDFVLWGSCFVLALPLTVLSISGLRIDWDQFQHSTLLIVVPIVCGIQYLLWESLKDIRYKLVYKDKSENKQGDDKQETLSSLFD